MTLGDYLAASGRRPWSDGEHDCCAFPAGWVILCGFTDPMAAWRGTYADAEEARALIDAAGGLLALWERALSHVPALGPEEAPEEGDVGVVRVVGADGPIESGGIFTGKRWAFLAPRGLFVSSIDAEDVLRVWRPCPR